MMWLDVDVKCGWQGAARWAVCTATAAIVVFFMAVTPLGAKSPPAQIHRTTPAEIATDLAPVALTPNRAATGSAGVKFDVAGLESELEAILGRVERRARASVHVRALDSQQVLFDHHGDATLNPASNQKLITASAAIDLLGPDYRFETRISRAGDDLVLRGEGDPTLHADDLGALAEQIVGLNALAGVKRLVVDASAFSPRHFGPGYSPKGVGLVHQAPSGAASLDFNTVEITVFPQRGRRKLGVRVYPPSDHFIIESTAVRGKRYRLRVSTESRGDRTLIRVSGSTSRRTGSATFRRRITSPGLFTGRTLAAALAAKTSSPALPVVVDRQPPSGRALVSHESRPLIEIVDDSLTYSNNFMAEQLLRTLAWRRTGNPGGWGDGQRVLANYWTSLGQPAQSAVFVNASGFCQGGRVSSRGLVDLISSHQGLGLIDALPVAGDRGTLRRRLRASSRRVRAKTGTLQRAGGLTGVITSESGKPQVAFSILINGRDPYSFHHSQRRTVEDRIVMTVLRHMDDARAKAAAAASR
jgi:D-alanyl-D-alanine carboxypeptidase/D-alanyl-D-alanine-endopeptidase (penicillin-binding protein 4)